MGGQQWPPILFETGKAAIITESLSYSAYSRYTPAMCPQSSLRNASAYRIHVGLIMCLLQCRLPNRSPKQ